MAGRLVELGDLQARELSNDLEIALKQISDELDAYVKGEMERLKAEYARAREKKLRNVRTSAELNMEEAVTAVYEEIKRLPGEV